MHVKYAKTEITSVITVILQNTHLKKCLSKAYSTIEILKSTLEAFPIVKVHYPLASANP